MAWKEKNGRKHDQGSGMNCIDTKVNQPTAAMPCLPSDVCESSSFMVRTAVIIYIPLMTAAFHLDDGRVGILFFYCSLFDANFARKKQGSKWAYQFVWIYFLPFCLFFFTLRVLKPSNIFFQVEWISNILPIFWTKVLWKKHTIKSLHYCFFLCQIGSIS